MKFLSGYRNIGKIKFENHAVIWDNMLKYILIKHDKSEVQMWFKILLSVLVLLNLAGCATTKKESAKMQIQQLQSQISDLEMQLKQRDEEIQGLESELSKAESAKGTQLKAASGETSKPSSKQIQTALKNAGFYEGPIDGKVGKNTKKAIRTFQEANGLTADGVVGNKTWSKLKVYLP